MKHLTDQELTEAYYGESTPGIGDHLRVCSECQSNYRRLGDLLGSVQQYTVPEPDRGFEGRVWLKLSERLPKKRSWSDPLFRPIVLAPVLSGLLILALVFGLLRERRHGRPGISFQAQTRVLFNTLSEHLDRSEILLEEVANAEPGPNALKNTQATARDLADQNRLLRLASNRAGDISRGALLEDLERILLSLANAPANFSPDDLSALQKRINEGGLLFKMRIIDGDLRREERNL